MLNNNLKFAWRYLMKDRQFTFLNIIGLSTGLACTILIYLWVKDEGQMDYDLLRGNADQVLTDERSIALSDVLATRLFGTANVIGRTVETGEFQQKQVYKVSGVFRDPGPHSSDQFDFVLPARVMLSREKDPNDWGDTFASTYLTLRSGTSVEQFNARIADYIRRKTNNQITYRTPFLTRYSDNYLHGRYQDGRQVGGRIEYAHYLGKPTDFKDVRVSFSQLFFNFLQSLE